MVYILSFHRANGSDVLIWTLGKCIASSTVMLINWVEVQLRTSVQFSIWNDSIQGPYSMAHIIWDSDLLNRRLKTSQIRSPYLIITYIIWPNKLYYMTHLIWSQIIRLKIWWIFIYRWKQTWSSDVLYDLTLIYPIFKSASTYRSSWGMRRDILYIQILFL